MKASSGVFYADGMSRQRISSIWLAILAVLALASCASTQREKVLVSAPKAETFAAVTKALVTSGYQIVATDPVSGVVSAERPIKDLITRQESGENGRVTVLVESVEAGCLLSVTWTPPAWALGDADSEHQELLDALSRALPDAQIR